MIKGLMKHKNVDQLPIMIKNAQDLGIKIILYLENNRISLIIKTG